MSKSSLSDNLKERIIKECRSLLKTQIRWRRHFHQHPELSNQEFKTTLYIKEQIRKIGIKPIKINIPTGVLAEIKGSKPGKTAAVRTDIDALPITELTELKFASKNKGCMHACGHDTHMAVILGVATILSNFRKEFPGHVRFIFQPAEETPPGGARPMIANGAIKNVDMIFGLHVDPTLSTGKIGLRDGVVMASVNDFDLIIHGRGGHAARPHDTVDAIVTATEIVESIQKIVSREIDPIEPVVITFGKFEGGTARNIICDKVTLSGTARTLSVESAKKIPKLIRKTADGICRSRGAKLEMKLLASYPVLVNHPKTNEIIQRNFEILFGKNKIAPTDQTMGSEDFACYLEKTKGAMFRLGVMNKKIKADKPWHSPHFIVDEEAIFYGTATIVSSVMDYLLSSSK
jgi:amidohydrolase